MRKKIAFKIVKKLTKNIAYTTNKEARANFTGVSVIPSWFQMIFQDNCKQLSILNYIIFLF